MLSLKEWGDMMPPDEFEARARERRRQRPNTDWLSWGSALIALALWTFVITAIVWGWMA